MKKLIAFLLVVSVLLSILAGCGKSGADNTVTDNTVTETPEIEVPTLRMFSADDLGRAMNDAGYQTEIATGNEANEELAGAGLYIENTLSTAVVGFHKIEEQGGVEKGGYACFYEFADSDDALKEFYMLTNMLTQDESILLYEMEHTYATKNIAMRNEGSDFGNMWVMIRMENIVFFAMEQWDFDGDGFYNYELDLILKSFGF